MSQWFLNHLQAKLMLEEAASAWFDIRFMND